MECVVSLEGKKGMIFGMANEHSIAYGVAKVCREAGADIGVTYLNAKAEPYVRPLAEDLKSSIIMPCNVQQPGELEAVFARIREQWGRLDFLLHAIAYAPLQDLRGRLVDVSQEGWNIAMDVSVHSFIRMAKLAEPLMTNGGCLLTLSYLGGERVIRNYKMMGPVKAALQQTTEYLAAELGDKGIRVHTISPGPIMTRAASGLADFESLLEEVYSRAPEHYIVSAEDVGFLAAYLASDRAKGMTGNLTYLDSGYNIMGD
ncbi:MAG TPA: enoyl-ACP reductase FabI [Deltaproteobacteria bacterium]|nr:enoyl-ACP reductase FabI [Deltaproteobacteria bacterium]HQI01565.1 enoyl-ACP reductase FabI [Deltaproteobacteria bacterium]